MGNSALQISDGTLKPIPEALAYNSHSARPQRWPPTGREPWERIQPP